MTVACLVDNDGITHNGDDLSEPELYELIVDYIRSDKLRALKNEDMAQLLLLEDMLSDLLANDAREVEASQAPPLTTGDATTHQQGCPTPPPSDYNHSDPPAGTLTKDIPIYSLHMKSDSQILPPSTCDEEVHPAEENGDTHSHHLQELCHPGTLPLQNQPSHSQQVRMVLPLVECVRLPVLETRY